MAEMKRLKEEIKDHFENLNTKIIDNEAP
jgi:hypothetical protein